MTFPPQAIDFEGFRVGDRFQTLGRTVSEFEAEGLALQTGILHGTGLALLHYDVRVEAPVLANDTVRVEIEVVDKRETRKMDRGVVTFRHRVLNQRDEIVMEATISRMIKRRP